MAAPGSSGFNPISLRPVAEPKPVYPKLLNPNIPRILGYEGPLNPKTELDLAL